MEKLLVGIGRAAGIVGVLLCLVAAGVRLGGSFWIGSMPVGTLLTAGTALMVGACLCFLAVLVERSRGA